MKIILCVLLATVIAAEELPKTAEEAFEQIDWDLFENGNVYCEPKPLAAAATTTSRRPGLQGRIYKGQFITAQIQPKYKYVVRLISDNKYRRGVTVGCGGALIDKNHVLTAAHCLKDESVEYIDVEDITGTVSVKRVNKHEAKSTQLYFGVLDLDKVKAHEEGTESRIAYAEDFTIHPKWDPAQPIVKYDIAIIKISDVIPDAKSKFAYINLPPPEICGMKHDELKSSVDISGWGMTDQKTSTKLLKGAQILVRSHSLCEDSFNGYDKKSMLCANTDEGTGTCGGDSGGPLAYTDSKNSKQYLLGITSYGARDCTDGRPSVFTDVCSYNDWIEKNMK